MMNYDEILESLGIDPSCINFNKPFDQVATYNASVGKLNLEDGYDCQKCKNRGDYMKLIDGYERLVPCECMKIRSAIRELKKSGLESFVKEMSFTSYKAVDDLSVRVKNLAIENINSSDWFFIGGQSGAGKTHISTALAIELLRRSKAVLYKRYVETMRELKAAKFRSDSEYYSELVPILNAEVLYIDDLFKEYPGDWDKAEVWQIIDDRYSKRLKTIISSELDLKEIARIDESLAGRIKERAGKFSINIEKNKKYNRRLDDEFINKVKSLGGLKNGIIK